MDSDPLKKLEDLTNEIHAFMKREGRPIFRRYPLMFAFLATFGFSAIIYGFQGIVDRIPLLYDNPALVLVGGVVILLITGTLYRKLKKE